MEKQIVPQDIQEDADILYPQIVRPKDGMIMIKEGKSDYIQGRIDERGKLWTDEDIKEALKQGYILGQINYGIVDGNKWLETYRKLTHENNDNKTT
jgi:hypothetical protein